MTLPKAEIQDIIINPSDYEIYYESGKWDHEIIKNIQNESRTLLEANAMSENILEKAEKSALVKLTNLFKTFGFDIVNITIPE